MVNYRFRHGPALGVKPTTDHRSAKKAHKHAVSKVGWCQICCLSRVDRPGIKMRWWQEGLEWFQIAVCKEHLEDERLARPDW